MLAAAEATVKDGGTLTEQQKNEVEQVFLADLGDLAEYENAEGSWFARRQAIALIRRGFRSDFDRWQERLGSQLNSLGKAHPPEEEKLIHLPWRQAATQLKPDPIKITYANHLLETILRQARPAGTPRLEASKNIRGTIPEGKSSGLSTSISRQNLL